MHINLSYTNQVSDYISDYILRYNYDKIVCLTDENTEVCYEQIPYLRDNDDILKISIPSGESNKTLETVEQITEILIEENFSRQSLLINLGGGVISDLGGFIASIFKRGIPYINIPTSIMGIIDASIGGKTGVNFKHQKNQIGSFHLPNDILISTIFLRSLPQVELINGWAEAIKYAYLNQNLKYLPIDLKLDTSEVNIEIIQNCAEFKREIVNRDYNESGLRKILNFGHTIGHAIESYSQEINQPIGHGYAIAIGLLVEMQISISVNGCSENDLSQTLKQLISKYYYPLPFDLPNVVNLEKYLNADKKNSDGKIKMVLCNREFQFDYDCIVSSLEIENALQNEVWLK